MLCTKPSRVTKSSFSVMVKMVNIALQCVDIFGACVLIVKKNKGKKSVLLTGSDLFRYTPIHFQNTK